MATLLSIKTNDPVKDNEGLFVAAPSGDYNDVDLLECYHESNPGVAICMLQAQCIKFGNVVYKQNEPLNDFQISALLQGVSPDDVINNEDLLKRQVVDLERSGKVVGKVGVLKQAEMATVVEEPVTIEEFTDAIDPKKSTPPVIDRPVTENQIPNQSSTQNPPYFETLPPSDTLDTSTTTPALPIDTSTTTPSISTSTTTPGVEQIPEILPETPPLTEVVEAIQEAVETIVESTTAPQTETP